MHPAFDTKAVVRGYSTRATVVFYRERDLQADIVTPEMLESIAQQACAIAEKMGWKHVYLLRNHGTPVTEYSFMLTNPAGLTNDFGHTAFKIVAKDSRDHSTAVNAEELETVF